jgi:hypothetical protein
LLLHAGVDHHDGLAAATTTTMPINPAMGDYRPGSILRITLKNFMTHESVVIEPGPRYVSHSSCCWRRKRMNGRLLT